jgi:hypothetical protein
MKSLKLINFCFQKQREIAEDYWPRIRELGQSLNQGGKGFLTFFGEFESRLGEEVLKDSTKKG